MAGDLHPPESAEIAVGEIRDVTTASLIFWTASMDKEKRGGLTAGNDHGSRGFGGPGTEEMSLRIIIKMSIL
jgi:hypothetical protein